MTDTRMVRLDQIAAGKLDRCSEGLIATSVKMLTESGRQIDRIYVRQIGDATGGDVFEPVTIIESALAEAYRRAKWPHPVQVEVING